MLVFIIKDLKVCLSNGNMLTGKKIIFFGFYVKKERLVNKRLVHYIINTKSLFYRSVYWFGENLGQKPLFASISDCFNPQKTVCPEKSLGESRELEDCNNFELI